MSAPTRRHLRRLASLKRARARREEGLFLVEGVRLVRELLASPVETREVLVDADRADQPALAKLLAALPSSVPRWEVTERALRALASTVEPQGVVAVAAVRSAPLPELVARARRLLVLDRVADPGNAGTLFRSALAFGVDAVLLARDGVDPTSPKVVRSSMGALFHLPWAAGGTLDELAAALSAAGVQLLAATPRGGADPRSLALGARWALLLGSEATGLATEAGTPVTLPMSGPAESLNVAVAGSLLLYELSRAG